MPERVRRAWYKPVANREVKAAGEIPAKARYRWRGCGGENGSRGAALLVALAFAASLALALGTVVGRETAAAPAPSVSAKTVALLSVRFLNDHEDLEPTTDAERTRLASIAKLFESELEASGQYKFVPLRANAAAKIEAGPQIGACGGCEFDDAQQLGSDFAAWIVVQKVSDLILNVNVYIADVAARKLTFVHSVDIRGNTDESWTRGLTYLVKNYLLANP